MNPEEIEWAPYIVQLTAYAHGLMTDFSCFTPAGNGSLFAGKEDKDYAMDAIEKYLRNHKKFDPSRGRSLLNYLKYHLVRGLIINDSRLKEFKKTSRITDMTNDEGELNVHDLLSPLADAHFANTEDYKILRSFITERIGTDRLAENIFTGLYDHGLTRQDVIQEFQLTESDYNNGFRRLKTLFRQAAALHKYSIDKK